MATLHRERCFYTTNEPCFEGRGWAQLLFSEIGWGALEGEFEPVIFQGRCFLRVLYVERASPGCLYVVEANNWRWPVWWVLLRLWRFLVGAGMWAKRYMEIVGKAGW